jgi:disulfide bond formation protein DsbB
VPSTDLAITFFTTLTLLANATTVSVTAAAVAGRFGARQPWQGLRDELVAGGPTVAWLVAAVATSGSLYFSEVADFVPCRLCWVQRACMYPLVLLLLVPRLRRFAVALAGLGAVVATYHVLLERFPSLESSGTCDPQVPCSLVWFERLGFVTLPYMALSGFVLVVALLLPSLTRSSPSPTGHRVPEEILS